MGGHCSCYSTASEKVEECDIIKQQESVVKTTVDGNLNGSIVGKDPIDSSNENVKNTERKLGRFAFSKDEPYGEDLGMPIISPNG